MNIIQQLEKEQLEKLSAGKAIPDFEPGDTVIVNVKVVEGERTRIQAYEGVCIGRSGRGVQENFTVRKISYGEGVERVFRSIRRWSTRSSWCAAARSAAPSCIICAACAASRRASPKARTTAASPRTWAARTRSPDAACRRDKRQKGRLSGLFAANRVAPERAADLFAAPQNDYKMAHTLQQD